MEGCGRRAALLVPGATDRDGFLRFWQQVLGPHLRPGAVAVMDNLSAHTGADVAEAVEKAGAQLCCLPPYAPDYNPMEPAGSKITTLRRGMGARPPGKLYRSLHAALAQVTAQDAEAGFKHCGYPLH